MDQYLTIFNIQTAIVKMVRTLFIDAGSICKRVPSGKQNQGYVG
jgi:hypothetical protein